MSFTPECNRIFIILPPHCIVARQPAVLSWSRSSAGCSRAASKLKFIATEPLEIPSAVFSPCSLLLGLWPPPSNRRDLGPGQARAGQCKEWCCCFSVYFLASPTGRVCGSRLLVPVLPLGQDLLLDKKCDVSPLESAEDDGASEMGNRESAAGNMASRIGNRKSGIAHRLWLPVSLGFSSPVSSLVTCHHVATAK